MLLVSWLINKTPRDQILSAIIYLLYPLKIFGLPVNTLALRIELIFRHIDDVRMMLIQKKDNISSSVGTIAGIGNLVSGIYYELVESIDKKALNEISINIQPSAPLKQFLIPFFLFLTLYLIHNFL